MKKPSKTPCPLGPKIADPVSPELTEALKALLPPATPEDPLATSAEQARSRLQAKFDFYRSYGISAKTYQSSAGGWFIKVTSSLNSARPLSVAIPAQMDYDTLDLFSRTILDSFECGQAIGSEQTKQAIKVRLGQIVDGPSEY